MNNPKHPIEVGTNITRLIPYRPGKPIEEVKRELGLTDVVKLASNENPLGPSPKAVEALREAAHRVHLYPDASCYSLRAAVARHLDVPEDCLVFGNGSDDIIHLLGVTLLSPGDEVVQADPSFVRYEAAAVLNRANCHLVPLRDWTHDLEAMAQRLNEKTRIIFIANPNNPTGTSVSQSQVDRFLERVPPRAVVVFDEAYFEYVERADFPNTIGYVRQGLNVVTLRTFSKVYGLAGVRVGYGVTTPQLADYLNRVREPFNVNLLAQEAALAALGDEEHLRLSRDTNRAGKRQLYRGFDALDLPYVPTDANFVWVDVRRDCQDVFLKLLQKGVIVRTGDIFGAETWLRVTIGTADQNERFLTALAEAL